MSKVYVVQNVKQVSHRTGGLESKYDHSRAMRYGELVYLVDGQVRIWSQSSVLDAVADVKDKLANITIDDYLLLVGDPVLIGVACGYAMDVLRGRLKLLQWDRRRLDYEVIEIGNESIQEEWNRVWNKDRD
jgi:hypothetical protein